MSQKKFSASASNRQKSLNTDIKKLIQEMLFLPVALHAKNTFSPNTCIGKVNTEMLLGAESIKMTWWGKYI